MELKVDTAKLIFFIMLIFALYLLFIIVIAENPASQNFDDEIR